MKVMELFKKARLRGVPILAINTQDIGVTTQWIIDLKNGSEIPILLWDPALGLRGKNKKGHSSLNLIFGTDNLEDISSATRDPCAALNIIRNTEPDTISIFCNLHKYISQPDIIAAVYNCRDIFKEDFRTLVILSHDFTPPPELKHHILIIDEELLTEDQILTITKDLFSTTHIELPEESVLNKIISAMKGLPSFPVEQSIALSFNKKSIDIEALWQQKRKMIEITDGLESPNLKETFSDLGGLEQAKGFMQKIFSGPNPPKVIIRIEEIEKALAGSKTEYGDSSGVSQDALATLLNTMEDEDYSGLICVGIPGTAKSAFAKAIGPTFSVPGITFDFGAMKNSLVGESEARIRSALKVIKAVAGREGAFFVATCNEYRSITPALKRRFRYGTFYFDLPTQQECKEIWNIQRKRYKINKDYKEPENINLTGADIRNVCELSFRLNIDLEQAICYIVPVVVSDPAILKNLRESAENRWLSASYPGVYIQRQNSGNEGSSRMMYV